MGRAWGQEGTPDTTPLTSPGLKPPGPLELSPAHTSSLTLPRSVVAQTWVASTPSMVMPVELEAFEALKSQAGQQPGAGLRLLSLKWGWGRWGWCSQGEGRDAWALSSCVPQELPFPNLLSSPTSSASCLETNPTRHTTQRHLITPVPGQSESQSTGRHTPRGLRQGKWAFHPCSHRTSWLQRYVWCGSLKGIPHLPGLFLSCPLTICTIIYLLIGFKTHSLVKSSHSMQ